MRYSRRPRSGRSTRRFSLSAQRVRLVRGHLRPGGRYLLRHECFVFGERTSGSHQKRQQVFARLHLVGRLLKIGGDGQITHAPSQR